MSTVRRRLLTRGQGPGGPQRPRRLGWRLAVPVAVAASGALFAVSAVNSDGTDLRPGRYTDLASLVQSDADDYQQLRAQVADLNAQVDQLTQQVDDQQVRRRQRAVDRLRGPAGLEPVTGAGVTVVLYDAPKSKLEAAAATGDKAQLFRYFVHQQDIQAVVNAMWSGGATGVTVQGQRIITTTGIKCTGNSVQLQGVPYPAPYTIQAVGDPASLLAALAAAPGVQSFRDDTADPTIDVDYAERVDPQLALPAYDGLVDLTSATPIAGH